ncbi:MAG: IS3 family transposase [Armatimonadetes bacterium]|nr:IS3 family transposase [Armatimonadota bacterium]
MESFFATLKAELIHQRHFATCAQARRSIFDDIEVFSNRQRLLRDCIETQDLASRRTIREIIARSIQASLLWRVAS